MKMTFKQSLEVCTLMLGMALTSTHAADCTVSGPDGTPLPLFMVKRSATQPTRIEDSDNGYAASGKLQQGTLEAHSDGHIFITASYPRRLRADRDGNQINPNGAAR